MSSAVAGMAKRLEELLAGLGSAGSRDGVRERAEELVRTVVAVYGAGLERLLEILHAELGDRSDEVFARLCEDKLVEELLCLHGLHPIPVEDRVADAMRSVLPYIKSHRGNMEITRIEGDVVYLRLEGSCDGCPASATTLKLSVERAILDRVPEIREVRAEDSVDTLPGHAAESTLRILSPV